MIDIQNQQDDREIPLQKVGVKGLSYPVKVLDKKKSGSMYNCNCGFIRKPSSSL